MYQSIKQKMEDLKRRIRRERRNRVGRDKISERAGKNIRCRKRKEVTSD